MVPKYKPEDYVLIWDDIFQRKCVVQVIGYKDYPNMYVIYYESLKMHRTMSVSDLDNNSIKVSPAARVLWE